MPAEMAQDNAVQRRMDAVRACFGAPRGAGGSLSRRQTAGACGDLNRTSAWAGDISGGGLARHSGHHPRVPGTQLGRQPGRHVGAAGRFAAMPGRETDAAVIQAAGEARGARTGR
jgi:hypothetical protein